MFEFFYFSFLGREYEYLKNNNYQDEPQQYDETEDVDDDEEEEDDTANEQTGDLKNTQQDNINNIASDNDADVEFFEISGTADDNQENSEDGNDDGDDDAIDELKKPGGGNKRKKKKKGQQHELATQAANLLVIQPLEHQLAAQHHDDVHGATQLLKPVITNKIKPLKQKKRKRKKGGHGGTATIVVEQEPASDHLALGLLEELAELGGDDGGKRKRKHPMKYGRSNGGVCLNNFFAPFSIHIHFYVT